MKGTIEDLQDTFQIGFEQYESSKVEARTIWDQYHNRQYTEAQLALLKSRGQPAETFNVVKLFARMLLGYYSSVVNTTVTLPVGPEDIATASILNDVINYVFRDNNFDSEADKIKLSGLISGLLISFVDVIPTGKKDEFGRDIHKIKIAHVPDNEVVLDPSSKLEDYSDATWIHRFKWITEDKVVTQFGKAVLDKLDEYDNHLNRADSEFEFNYNGQFTGKYKVHNNYLIVHTIMQTEDGKTWSKFWSGDHILKQNEVTHKEVKMPYRVQKLHVSDSPEHYGIFREVTESQKAINQALIKLQLMSNTEKVLVEKNSVEDIDDFADAFNRVSGVVEVLSLKGIEIVNMSSAVSEQYIIIDKALDRIQRVLSINDSFLGLAFASDSGRKVKLQQNATIVALRYLTNRVEQFYRLLSWDIANLVKQYYYAHQFIRIADNETGQRWHELNRPAEIPNGQVDPETGEEGTEFAFEEVLDPASGKPTKDSQGNILVAPIPDAETELKFTNVDIEIQSVAYNDEDEKNQLMLETTLAGNIGNLLSQVNPAGFFKAASLAVKTMKTKHSPDIANILDQTAEQLGGSPEAEQEAKLAAGGQNSNAPLSQQQKLPQNTNEGVG